MKQQKRYNHTVWIFLNDHINMSSPASLADRLADHPKLEHRVSALLDIVEAEFGLLDRADDAEEAVIANLRSMGNELLTDWSACKEDQKFSVTCLKHPEAKAQKKHLLVQYLRKDRHH